MVKRKVAWSPLAKQTLKGTLNYYNKIIGNNKYSLTLNKHFKKMTLNIKNNNFIGKATEDQNLRVLIYRHFEMFYRVFEKEIRISLIWDSRRNPEDLKKLL
jgi:hypothetical protein